LDRTRLSGGRKQGGGGQGNSGIMAGVTARDAFDARPGAASLEGDGGALIASGPGGTGQLSKLAFKPRMNFVAKYHRPHRRRGQVSWLPAARRCRIRAKVREALTGWLRRLNITAASTPQYD